jgi:hypothetical protein
LGWIAERRVAIYIVEIAVDKLLGEAEGMLDASKWPTIAIFVYIDLLIELAQKPCNPL